MFRVGHAGPRGMRGKRGRQPHRHAMLKRKRKKANAGSLSLPLPARLLGAAVQPNQQQGPHQSIIISLSPWIPPAPPPP